MPATTTAHRLAATLTAAALSAALATSAGCYYPGGPGYSADRFTYESTTWQPWTVSIEDTRTGQEFWSVEVPVGQQLVVDFIPGEGAEGDFTPDLMRWQVMPIGHRFGTLANSLPVPPATGRILLPRLRDTPELPGDMIAAQGGPPPVRVINNEPMAE